MKIYTLGRGSECSVRLPDDDSLSRRHASITVVGPQELHVQDLGSSNGTFFLSSGKWLREPKGVLRPGGCVRFGSREFTFTELANLLAQSVYDVPGAGGLGAGALAPATKRGEFGRPRRNPMTGEIEEGEA